MTPENLQQVREVFDKAAEMAAEARDRYITDACAGKPELREEIERLLAASERVPGWLNQPALGSRIRLPRIEQPKLEGRQLGPYTLVREIGRGGMGCVYLAERTDGSFHLKVAVKLLLPSPNSARMISRFQQERQILASLDHPNIARLLDGGMTEEGWPYFIMEYVEGRPIHLWCDEQKLNVSQRIELFRGVLAAVRYAHQHLVVHRDLKPGNILVQGDGTVKLLDFGIAKIVAPEHPGPADTVTLAAMMTPEYASPEQISGATITTLSDVYSLGVVLYELLTGHRPYRLLSAALHEMARVIAEVEPPRPSDVVTLTERLVERAPVTPESVSAVREGDLHRLRRRLAGDLDSIVLMSLRKEPELRYGSVDALAADLENHLSHRPVIAHEETPWQRFRRYCRRNPGTLLASVLIVVPLLTGLFAVVWQMRRELVQTHRLSAGTNPFNVVSFGVVFVLLGVTIYFARPGWKRFCAALTGSLVWMTFLFLKIQTTQSMGWWQSQLGNIQSPLSIWSPQVWILIALALTAILFLVSWVWRRFGWTWLLAFLVGAGLYQAARERVWFSELLPMLKYEPGIVPILAEALIFAAGGLAAFLTMRTAERLLGDSKPASSQSR